MVASTATARMAATGFGTGSRSARKRTKGANRVARSPRCFQGWSIYPRLPHYPPDPTASTLLLPRIHASERLLVVIRPASQSAFR
jgi:hypothetical protein